MVATKIQSIITNQLSFPKNGYQHSGSCTVPALRSRDVYRHSAEHPHPHPTYPHIHTFTPPSPNVSIPSFHTPLKKCPLNDVLYGREKVCRRHFSPYLLTFLYPCRFLAPWLSLLGQGSYHTVKCGPQDLYF